MLGLGVAGLEVVSLEVVSMGSVSSESRYCVKHGLMTCPICKSALIEIVYKGEKPDILALTKRADFRCFVGCVRVELHNKVVDGVDCRGQVFIKVVFKEGSS